MPKVILVNPAHFSTGFSFFTPRWLFVLAAATPPELGDPVLVDETISPFDPAVVETGDIVGIGICTGNCMAGYKILSEAKRRGATVVFGGIHTTIFPHEPLQRGADAVVTGNGDVIWSRVVGDALRGRLQRRYDGGRIAGEQMRQARWDLLDPSRYLFPTVQTVAGCPENCSFCSVWITDGRQPRMRLHDQVIAEANELYSMGFRYIAFADDNFSPSTTARIKREPSLSKRTALEAIRSSRLQFFEEYGKRVPNDLVAITQLTSEIASDDEYLNSLYENTRLRGVLIGVESFHAKGLELVNKQWNLQGADMANAIAKIQQRGMIVLASVITGLEFDDPDTLQSLRRQICNSGVLLAQFTYFNVYPGTKDYHELVRDLEESGEPKSTSRHKVRLYRDGFWLDHIHASQIVAHPQMSRDVWRRETEKCWKEFYSLRQALRRMRSPILRSRPLGIKLTYILAGFVFRRFWGSDGLSADSVRRKGGLLTRVLVRIGTAAFSRTYRTRRKLIDVKPVDSRKALADA
jgi:radical SAM superfamily enzyme YgiQ (UPF0313 family)